MTVVSEAVQMMPSARKEEIFGADPASLVELDAEHTPVTDAEMRSFLKIPDSFDSGSRGEWVKQSNEFGGIKDWASAVRANRTQIAEAAKIDPAEMQRTMDAWWVSFGSKQSAKCPTIEDFYDIDREVATKIAFPGYPLEMAIGYGGTNDQQFSSRTLGWAVPGLDFVQSFEDLGLEPPKLRLFFAHELSTEVNNLDIAVAQAVSATSAEALEKFVAVFYPEIRDHIEVTTPQLEKIKQSLGTLGINGNAPDILNRVGEENPKLKKQIDRLYETGRLKGSTVYGTAEYIMGHLIPELFGTYIDPNTGSVSVIKGGGPSEKDFTDLQRAVAKEHPNGTYARTHTHTRPDGLYVPRQAAIVGKNGKVAPYYADKNANDIVILPDSSMPNTYDPNRKLDRCTQLAANRAKKIGSSLELFMHYFAQGTL